MIMNKEISGSYTRFQITQEIRTVPAIVRNTLAQKRDEEDDDLQYFEYDLGRDDKNCRVGDA